MERCRFHVRTALSKCLISLGLTVVANSKELLVPDEEEQEVDTSFEEKREIVFGA